MLHERFEPAADGGVFAFGNAPFRGSAADLGPAPVKGIEAIPNSQGYWLFSTDGGVFAFEAPFLGSLRGNVLRAPVVGMATVPR